MRYIQTISILLAICFVSLMLIVPTQSSEKPPFPDLAIVLNAENWMEEWEEEEVVPVTNAVENSYKALSGLVSAYKDSITSVGDQAFSSLTSSVQTGVVSLIMSAAGKTKDVATSIAKTHTLQSAVQMGANQHSQWLYYFDTLWSKHGGVMQDIVWTEMNKQRNDGTGTFTLSANTMMEAYYKVTYVAELYNKQVAKWNEYAYKYEPNQIRSPYYPKSPTYPTFSKFKCFGGCGYEHDTLDYARDTHKVKCGTAKTVAEAVGWSNYNQKWYSARYKQALKKELASRKVSDGCGLIYYACNPSDKELHDKKDCPSCSSKYRNCLPHTKDNCKKKKSPSVGFAPASGSSYTASAGDKHTGQVTAPSIYGAYFYVNGSSQGWFGGSQSATSLSFSYTFPSSASGSYTMKALVYPWSGSSYGSPATYSYTVTVGSTTTTTTTTTTSTPSTSTETDDDDDDDTDSDSDDDDDDSSSKSPYSLSGSSTGSPFQPGDKVTLTLSGNESIYSVDWSLVSPQYPSSSSLSSDYKGESGHYDSSVTYTFPSAYQGDFVFTAVVYTHGNMTRYEHTYTVTLGH